MLKRKKNESVDSLVESRNRWFWVWLGRHTSPALRNPFANIELDGFPYYCRFAIFCFSFALQSVPQFGTDTVAYKTSPETAPMGAPESVSGFRLSEFPSHPARWYYLYTLLFNSIEIFKAPRSGDCYPPARPDLLPKVYSRQPGRPV